MTPFVYRWLFVSSLLITVGLLSIPGDYLEELQQCLRAFWPFSDRKTLDLDSLPFDKVIHASLFGLSGVLLVKGWATGDGKWAGPCVLLFGVAIATEFVQMALPGRSMEVKDMLANSLGAGTGIGLAWQFDVARRRKKTV